MPLSLEQRGNDPTFCGVTNQLARSEFSEKRDLWCTAKDMSRIKRAPNKNSGLQFQDPEPELDR